MGEVVGLDRKPWTAPVPADTADPVVVAALEQLLEMAKAGELRGFTLSGEHANGNAVRSRCIDNVNASLIVTALATEHQWLLSALNDQEDD